MHVDEGIFVAKHEATVQFHLLSGRLPQLLQTLNILVPIWIEDSFSNSLPRSKHRLLQKLAEPAYHFLLAYRMLTEQKRIDSRRAGLPMRPQKPQQLLAAMLVEIENRRSPSLFEAKLTIGRRAFKYIWAIL